MTMNRDPIQIRQGDVFIFAIDTAALDLSPPLPRSPRGLVLQEGEVTGHAHAIARPEATLHFVLGAEPPQRILRVTAPVMLRHEEHCTECAACSTDAKPVLATHYTPVADLAERKRYTCDAHPIFGAAAPIEATMLDVAGETVILPGDYDVTIHGEYVPRAPSRNVED